MNSCRFRRRYRFTMLCLWARFDLFTLNARNENENRKRRISSSNRISSRCTTKENTRPLCYQDQTMHSNAHTRNCDSVSVCTLHTRTLSSAHIEPCTVLKCFSLCLFVAIFFGARSYCVHTETFSQMMNSWVCVCLCEFCHSAHSFIVRLYGCVFE